MKSNSLLPACERKDQHSQTPLNSLTIKDKFMIGSQAPPMPTLEAATKWKLSTRKQSIKEEQIKLLTATIQQQHLQGRIRLQLLTRVTVQTWKIWYQVIPVVRKASLKMLVSSLTVYRWPLGRVEDLTLNKMEPATEEWGSSSWANNAMFCINKIALGCNQWVREMLKWGMVDKDQIQSRLITLDMSLELQLLSRLQRQGKWQESTKGER